MQAQTQASVSKSILPAILRVACHFGFRAKKRSLFFRNNTALWSGSEVITPGLGMVRGEIAASPRPPPSNSNTIYEEHV